MPGPTRGSTGRSSPAARVAAWVALAAGLALQGAPRADTPHAGEPEAQTGGAQKWVRYDDPQFALLFPANDKLLAGAVREALADLDRLQPQIDAAPLAVRGRAQLLRGRALRGLGDLPGAERAARDSRELGRKAAHPFVEFDALILLVNLATARDRLDEAASLVAEAVPLADATDDDIMRFNVRLEQGRIARQRGRGADALKALDEAVRLADKVKALGMYSNALTSRSAARLGMSDYDGALADAERVYQLTGSPDAPPVMRAAAAASLGQALSQIGDLERGLDLWTEAVAAYTKANLLLGVSLGVRQRMDVRFALDDLEGAAEDGLRALELFAKTGSQGQEPAVLSRLSLIEARLGRREAAEAHARQAVTAAASATPRIRASVEADLANGALAIGQFATAATRFQRVLDQGRALGDLDIEWRALHGLGRSALGAKDTAGASRRFEESIAVVERARRSLPEAGLRADFVAERLGPYDGLIETLLARSSGQDDTFISRAFDTSERARGRALADLLAEARTRLTDPAVAAVRAQEVEFGKRLSTLQRSLADAATDADRARLVADLDRAEREFQALVVRIRRDTPRYAALAHPVPSSAQDVGRLLADDEAMVSFWLGADRGVAWLVSPSGLRSWRLPARRTIDREVARLQSAIAGGRLDDIRRIGASLHATLFAGLDYRRMRRLIVVPDGPLWRAPLAALVANPASDSWLIEQVGLSVVPSASLLASLAAPAASTRARQPGLVFGLETVPPAVRALRALYDERLLPAGPLTFASEEAFAVAKIVAADPRTAVFVNNRADETTFKRAIEGPFHVVHVAAHAMIDDRVPRRSALVLGSGSADDGLLQLNEIANLPLDVDLVVLSTCQSQVGRAVRGEGLVSLSRAFLLGGARSVAASLWSVDDRETSRLMPFFYTALRRGAAPDEALRTAQLQMIRLGGTAAAPVNWAGFVVMGKAQKGVF